MKRIASLAVLLASTIMAAAQTPAASDCPTAQSARAGFVVERNEKSKTDVFAGDGTAVRTILRYDGKTLLETTQFQGLFQLDRLDRGRRAVFRPKTNLAALFPLKVGQKINVEFEVEGSGRPPTIRIELFVKQADVAYIGPCKYDVLRIERRESWGDGPSRLIDIDYYAPALKLVIAKEYKDSGDKTTLIKFDRIYPIKP